MASIGFGQLLSVVQQLSVVALFAVTYEEPVDSFVRIFTVFTFDIEARKGTRLGLSAQKSLRFPAPVKHRTLRFKGANFYR